LGNVGFWHLADNPAAPAFVGYWSNSGHRSRLIKAPDWISERPARGGLSDLGAGGNRFTIIKCQRHSSRLIDPHHCA